MRKMTLTLLGAFLWLLAIPAQATIIISVVPSASNVTVGEGVEVALNISGLGVNEAPSVGSFDLNLNFDPAILSLIGDPVFWDPTLGDQLDIAGFGSDTEVKESGAGTINLFELSYDSIADLNDFQADSFTLVTLTFKAIAVGTSSLTVTDLVLVDAAGDSLTAEIQNSSVTSEPSTSIPLPSSLLLFATGLLGLRRYKQCLVQNPVG